MTEFFHESVTYTSPKRKRGETENNDPRAVSPSAPRLKTDLPTRPVKNIKVTNDGSPSTQIAGQLHGLNLQEFNHKPGLTLTIESRKEPQHEPWEETKDGDLIRDHEEKVPDISSVETSNDPCIEKLIHGTTAAISEDQDKDTPKTPLLKPQDPPSSPCHVIPKSRPKSPPLTLPPSPSSLTWQDFEITGHAPTDPSDDGYGINGIGFRPTPALAYARIQRRKQQVADWKSREAREARQKRSERRWKGEGTGLAKAAAQQQQSIIRKVRFIEG